MYKSVVEFFLERDVELCSDVKEISNDVAYLSGSFHGARYLTNGVFIDLEATVGTYELRSYGGEQ